MPTSHHASMCWRESHSRTRAKATDDVRDTVQDEESGQSEGWFVARQANEIEDRQRTGPAGLARDIVRRVRSAVVDPGRDNRPVVGPGLRWLGRHLP
ncbi:hypothetical protein V3N99_05390 [Dermatophilaceae bacterium Soc4.6]